MPGVRIGIDVGGTYTDAVAISNETYDIIGKLKIPTTHDDEEGVAKGIVMILKKIMQENGINPEDITFIAHGTTQATNALLEGDVANVGVLGMATGIDKVNAKNESNPGEIQLAKNKYLPVSHRFIDSKGLTDEKIDQQIEELLREEAEVIVASETYSVENPDNELRVIDLVKKKGGHATGSHEISELYGLKVRTRTAVVNASLIPKMLETADMTEKSVKTVGISSELMIMRCDGGVMNVEEVRKRPILTMLSGLAAGVAGALMYEKISDGIFFEVGGTSVDISVIKNGSVMIKNAQVGGHKTYVQSLDVRTLGLAGGSMVIVEEGTIVDVGPRSAHIAGIDYECFTPSEKLEDLAVHFIAPIKGDSKNHAVAGNQNGESFAYTLAGAANLLGYVPKDDYAHADPVSTALAWEAFGNHLGVRAEEAARQVIDIAIDKVLELVRDMMEEYELNSSFVTLVGGGGSASVLVPAMAEKAGMKWQIAKNAPYISTIGVALAMVREQIERSVIKPNEQDIKKIRSDIMDKIIQSGANEETVEITIEVDAQKNILRAIATGSTELRTKDLNQTEIFAEEMQSIAAESIGQPEESLALKAQTKRWYAFHSLLKQKKFFGLMTKKVEFVVVMDREGVVRFKHENAKLLLFSKQDLSTDFDNFLDEHTIYSDANATIPKVHFFFREKMLDLTGMQTKEQLISITELELEPLREDENIIAVVYQ